METHPRPLPKGGGGREAGYRGTLRHKDAEGLYKEKYRCPGESTEGTIDDRQGC